MRHLIQTFAAGMAGAVTVLVLLGATSIHTEGDIKTTHQLVSDVPTGTPPLVVGSTSRVPNLNADMVDGFDSRSFALATETYTKAEVEALLAASRDTRRAFYLTELQHTGADADGTDGKGAGVCATGFHFASFWEIRNLATLRYATDVEGGDDVSRKDDSGEGPPMQIGGWARTGQDSGAIALEGAANCLVWTSSATEDNGTLVALNNRWDLLEEVTPTTAPWNALVVSCNVSSRVWCVEDYPGAAGG